MCIRIAGNLLHVISVYKETEELLLKSVNGCQNVTPEMINGEIRVVNYFSVFMIQFGALLCPSALTILVIVQY